MKAPYKKFLKSHISLQTSGKKFFASLLFAIFIMLINVETQAQFQLYVKDSPTDDGSEPSPLGFDPWKGRDVWVRTDCNAGSGLNPGEDPYTTSTILQQDPTAGGSVCVYVNIRNRDTQGSTNYVAASSTSDDYVVKVYWAYSSSSLGFPAPWDGSETGGTPPKTLGGQVGQAFIDQDITVGGSKIFKINWNGVPDPVNFSGLPVGHFCLLVRIGKPGTGAMPNDFTGSDAPRNGFANLFEYVTENRGVTWRNINVNEPTTCATCLTTDGSIFGNPDKDSYTGMIAVKVNSDGNTDYRQYADIKLTLGNNLKNWWLQGNDMDSANTKSLPEILKRNGFALRGNDIYMANDSGTFNNIIFNKGQLDAMQITINPIKTIPKDLKNITVDIKQIGIIGGKVTVIGGVSKQFVFNTVHPAPSPHYNWYWIALILLILLIILIISLRRKKKLFAS
jgi:hypothetical protein